MEMSAVENDDARTGLRLFARRADYEELPPHSVAYYRDLVIVAKQQCDRLDRFLIAELARLDDDRSGKDVDWDLERKKRAKTLGRWHRETNGVIRELTRLLHDIRDDQAILKEYVLERSGKTSGERDDL